MWFCFYKLKCPKCKIIVDQIVFILSKNNLIHIIDLTQNDLLRAITHKSRILFGSVYSTSPIRRAGYLLSSYCSCMFPNVTHACASYVTGAFCHRGSITGPLCFS
uniref:Uncharacterized protein n=1 Tax=Cacopsylla melanoneura TaxID=428564 RepID=A0A8D8SKN6_9HEMI